MSEAIESKFNSKLILFLLSGTAASFLISLALLQVFAGLLIILFLFEENKRISFDLVGKFILAFAFARIISIIFSEYPSVSWHAIYKEGLFFLSFYAFNFYLKIIDQKSITFLLRIFFIAGFAVSIIGLIRFIFNAVERSQSFTSGYTTFSVYLIVVFTFLIFNYKTIKFYTEQKKFISILILSFLLAGIITSLGRTNIAIALLMTGAAFIFKRIPFKRVLVLVMLTTIISAGAFSLNSQAFKGRIESPAALSDRDIIYQGFSELYDENPLTGFGPRTFREIFPYLDQFADKGIGSWHNDYIEMYMESGIIGLIAFLGIFVSVFYSIYILFHHSNLELEEKNLSYGILFAVAALMLSDLTSGFIKSPVLSILFAMLIAFNQRSIYKYNLNP